MTDFYQGPGRNIDFCLITTGINIDPQNGSTGKAWYEWFKNVIIERAELHYENVDIREVFDMDVSSFLEAYSTTPRTAYQFLFGLVQHSNLWTCDTLTQAVNDAPLPSFMRPNDGDYCIAFDESKEAGFKLFENLLVSLVNVWVEKQQFYFSGREPIFQDGTSGDVWLVSNGLTMELWYKPAFAWFKLFEFAQSETPAGTVTYSSVDPGNTSNSWWLDITGISFRKYSEQLNIWEPAPPLTFSSTAPIAPADGDLWLNVVSGIFVLQRWSASKGMFEQVPIGAFPVQDKTLNSAFKSTVGDNNFVIVCGDDALLGLPIGTGGTNLEVRKDGVLIQTAVDCLNFIGPDLSVVSTPTCVNIEHLPYTTLPEQPGAPTPLPDVGRVFTLDIGGTTELFYIDDTGNIVQLTNNGSTTQNIFLSVSTFSAVAGQTVFSVPVSAKAVLTVKVNGLDTLNWTFTSPSVTYDPIGGGYTIQTGDEVTVIYYA